MKAQLVFNWRRLKVFFNFLLHSFRIGIGSTARVKVPLNKALHWLTFSWTLPSEWTRTGITYGHHSAEYPFGLRCPKNATRGLQSVIQAFIIKYFIFDNRPKEKSVPLEKLLKPTESEQVMALWNSISEILWNVGEKTKTIVCLPGDVPHISHSHAYFQDNVTEKVSKSSSMSF